MQATAAVELILSSGRKSSTYKLALLRATIDHVTEHPYQEARNGFHLLPVVDIARRVVAYYWRPTLLDVRQGSASNPRIPRLIVQRCLSTPPMRNTARPR